MSTWSSRFETGHPQIDTEHREFIRQLDFLRDSIEGGAGREMIVQLIVILQRYALGHFAREEAHMLRVDCPAHHENCAAHAEFGRKLDAWLALLSSGGASHTLLVDVHRESVAWIESHIVNVDCRLRPCGHRAAGSESAFPFAPSSPSPHPFAAAAAQTAPSLSV